MNDLQQLERMHRLEDQLASAHNAQANATSVSERAEYWGEIRSIVCRLAKVYVARYGAQAIGISAR